jgi:hypothetical protein
MGDLTRAAVGSVIQGMDGESNPIILTDTMYSKGINLSIKGGFAGTRPGFKHLDISGMPTGVFQGATKWSLDAGDRMVFVCDGIPYSIELNTLVLTKLSDTPLLNVTSMCYFCQANLYVVIQDGAASPVILTDEDNTPRLFDYDADASYANSDNPGYDEGTDGSFGEFRGSEMVPVGTIMHYAAGRLHVVPRTIPTDGGDNAVSGKPYFVSGDIILPGFPEDVLRFSETMYLGTGGAHGIPIEMGFIYGFSTLRSAQTGTGVGDLYALGSNGVAAFAVSIARSQWATADIAQGLFVGSGTKSHRAVTSVNNNIMFRGIEGIRSIGYTASAQWSAGTLSNDPMSTEVSEYMRDPAYLDYISSTHFDNYYLMTCSGIQDKYFQGIVAMDLSPAVRLGTPTAPVAYTGLWTGDTFGQVTTARALNKTLGFIFAEGPVLYFINDEDDFDTFEGETVDIESRLITKSFAFESFVLRKKLQYVDLWISDVTRDTSITVYAKPTGYPYWMKLSTKTVMIGEGGSSQTRQALRFNLDDDNNMCDPISHRPLYSSHEFQFAIEWTGSMQLDRAVFIAERLGEEPLDVCPETESVVLIPGSTAGLEFNDFSYRIRSI